MRDRSETGEFATIARVFAPLAADRPEALGLLDDAAVLAFKERHGLAITTDMLVAGVHFPVDDPADLIARRALRVNLSDLAAMGASPNGYFLALSVPSGTESGWFSRFAEGLAKDQKEHGISLLGGDMTTTPGPLSIAVTALGDVPDGAALKRDGATPGDVVMVSGTIGDAALGLEILGGRDCALESGLRDFLLDRYRLPQPRIGLGVALRGIATSVCDISDGLAADLGHICTASKVGAEIDIGKVPLSDAARTIVENSPEDLRIIVSGGDDYELVFTVAPNNVAVAHQAARSAGVPIAEIGKITSGDEVRIMGLDGQRVEVGSGGYRHF